MSFFMAESGAKTYAPGYFLADDENCVRKTYEMAASGATTGANGGKYIPMGTVYPSNTSSAIGIVYEDVDVTTGNMPGSVVIAGTVYEDKLPVVLDSDAKSALESSGFRFITTPEVTRPEWTNATPDSSSDDSGNDGE